MNKSIQDEELLRQLLSQSPLVDSVDMIAQIEQKMVDQELIHQLLAKLPNQLEQQMLLGMVHGENPRDIARHLGISAPHARLAKSRMLQRIRNDEELTKMLRILLDS